MMSLTFGLFSQVSASGPHGPLVYLSEGMGNCKLSGKNQGKVREFLR